MPVGAQDFGGIFTGLGLIVGGCGAIIAALKSKTNRRRIGAVEDVVTNAAGVSTVDEARAALREYLEYVKAGAEEAKADAKIAIVRAAAAEAEAATFRRLHQDCEDRLASLESR